MSITVYSRQGCSKCQDLKAFLNMLDIDFYEIDLDSNIDMTEVLREKGFRQLPIINFNDTWLSDSEEFKSDVRYKINFIICRYIIIFIPNWNNYLKTIFLQSIQFYWIFRFIWSIIFIFETNIMC